MCSIIQLMMVTFFLVISPFSLASAGEDAGVSIFSRSGRRSRFLHTVLGCPASQAAAGHFIAQTLNRSSGNFYFGFISTLTTAPNPKPGLTTLLTRRPAPYDSIS